MEVSGWFYPSESAPVPIKQDAAWMPQFVWVLGEEKIMFPPGIEPQALII
jgi:hypothetical protein